MPGIGDNQQQSRESHEAIEKLRATLAATVERADTLRAERAETIHTIAALALSHEPADGRNSQQRPQREPMGLEPRAPSPSEPCFGCCECCCAPEGAEDGGSGSEDGDEEDGLMLSGRGGQRRRAHPAKWQAYGTVGGGLGQGEGARQAAGGWRLARRRARRLCRRCWLSLGADDVLGRGAVCTPEMRVGFMLLGTLLLAVLVRWAVWAADAAGGASGTGTIDAGGGGAGAGAGVVAAAAGGGVLVNATNATNALPSLSGGGGTGFKPI